jgi:hypothetical protein
VISDEELRALVRDAIARHAGHVAPQPSTPAPPFAFRGHASHGLLPLARGGDGDGACLIEPAVRCTHCGYCLSYGH